MLGDGHFWLDDERFGAKKSLGAILLVLKRALGAVLVLKSALWVYLGLQMAMWGHFGVHFVATKGSVGPFWC